MHLISDQNKPEKCTLLTFLRPATAAYLLGAMVPPCSAALHTGLTTVAAAAALEFGIL